MSISTMSRRVDALESDRVNRISTLADFVKYFAGDRSEPIDIDPVLEKILIDFMIKAKNRKQNAIKLPDEVK